MTESGMDRLEVLTCPPQEIIAAATIILVQKSTDVNSDQQHGTHDETDSTMQLTPKKPEDEQCNLPEAFLTLSAMTFSTPQADKNSCCRDATCSVCLSPLLSRSDLIETRCKHVFHEKCLREAKGQKAECPNCRASLTPLQPEKNAFSSPLNSSVSQRDAIIARSVAARNAVRLGIARREQEARRIFAEQQDSNKENI